MYKTRPRPPTGTALPPRTINRQIPGLSNRIRAPSTFPPCALRGVQACHTFFYLFFQSHSSSAPYRKSGQMGKTQVSNIQLHTSPFTTVFAVGPTPGVLPGTTHPKG